jgi:molecular chaperone IbpA
MRTTTFDFAPLWRSTIGFDRLFDLADAAQRIPEEDHYPLRYRAARRRSLPDISAVAGFSPDDIAITAEQNVLTIEGRQSGQGSISMFITASLAATSSGGSAWLTTCR